MEGILGHYAGIICECGKRTNNGSQEALVSALILSLANNLILKEIMFPIDNMTAMDLMLSEVHNSTNHLLNNSSMDNVLKDTVPARAHNLLGTKIILKFEGLPSAQNKCRYLSRESRLRG